MICGIQWFSEIVEVCASDICLPKKLGVLAKDRLSLKNLLV